MKKLIITLILLSFQLVLFSQNLDLIVTTKGDSIVCKIDSITQSQIYFEMIANRENLVKTIIKMEQVREFKENLIDKKNYSFKPGTSIISGISKNDSSSKLYSIQNLEYSSPKELEAYMDKALKLKKTGKTLTIVGAVTLGAVALTIPLDPTGGFIAASALIFAGIPALAATTVGISMNVTGKKRVERINTIKNTAYDGIKIDLKPCAQYNFATQNYQPGVTLRIRF